MMKKKYFEAGDQGNCKCFENREPTAWTDMLQVIKYVPIIKVRQSGNRDPTARGDKTRF